MSPLSIYTMFCRNPPKETRSQGKLDLPDLMVDLVWRVAEEDIPLNSSSPELSSDPSRYVWLKAFGIFLGLLASLVILTLLTCRRPKQSPEVERRERRETVYVVEVEVEAPPCYQTIIEDEEKYLPSYREALQ